MPAPQRSHYERASTHFYKLHIAEPSLSLARPLQSLKPPVFHTPHSDTHPPRSPPTGDPNCDYVPNGLNAQIILACTIIGVQVNLLTSSSLPVTPLVYLFTTLGLVLELTGAVLAVGHLQRKPEAFERAGGLRQSPLEVFVGQTLPIAFILMGIAMFTIAVVLTMFLIKSSW